MSKRFASDYDATDVAFVYPELQGEHLIRAILHGAFPAPDYTGPRDAPFWHEATILRYTRGRATVEAASRQDPTLADFIRGAQGAE